MRKTILITTFLLLATLLPHYSYGSLDSFAGRMQSVVTNASKGNEVLGVEVVSLNRGDTLFGHNTSLPLNPASCTKIITTAAALKLLGPNYKFHTKFYTDKRPIDGRADKMWVKGYGDPSIVIERLWRIARDIANTGLREIDGDIVIDDYYFTNYDYPGYSDKSGQAYNSLTGAVSLNYNTVTVVVSPSSRLGSPPHVAPDSAGPYFRIINSAKTGPRGSKNTITVNRTKSNGEDVLTVRGNLPVEDSPQYIYRNITEPALYFGLALKSLLRQNGVIVNGNVIRGQMPGGGYLLLDSISKPLSLIVRDMNKYSNNFIAEQILKTLGAQIDRAPGSTKNGILVVKNYLSHLGISQSSYTLVNGSGLSLENKISAFVLVTVLANLFSDPRISHEAISSLPTSGTDGTIKDRYKTLRLMGLARAKTGTLNGVSTLVGIIPSTGGEVLGYAILMNGNGVGWEESHKIQEDMLNAMAIFAR